MEISSITFWTQVNDITIKEKIEHIFSYIIRSQMHRDTFIHVPINTSYRREYRLR